ncbi:MAG: ATP-dependent DNA helicase [Opitutales bacterium]|nr:ATP-dependent DNA helicase [Opitutales bacterium]
MRTPPEEPTPEVDVPALTERIFANEGLLQSALGLAHRRQQADMSLQVAQAFAGNGSLLCEAGTGVGKSLAYLIPGIIHAVAHRRQCLVSTHTISLQEQVMHKDLMLCRKLFNTVEELRPYAGFETAMLIGRGNYLCGTRLQEALRSKLDLFPGPEQKELERIERWARTTQNGRVQELNPPPLPEVWEWVNAEGHACSSKHCTPENCFYRRARQEVAKAQVVIVNHSLLFALIGAGFGPSSDKQGVLHAGDFVVLDEAHTVPAVATENLGEHISSYALNRLLLRLYHPKRRKGLMTYYGDRYDQKAVVEALEATSLFFDAVADALLTEQDTARIHNADWVAPILHGPLTALAQRLGDVCNKLEEGPARDEVKGLRTSLIAYNGAINTCISMSEEAFVYWAERGGRGKSIITLRTAPLDVAPALKEHLFNRQTAVVMTSATLADNSKLEGFRHKVGAYGAEGLVEDSPFDYENKTRVFVAADAPMPDAENQRLNIDWLADMIAYCALKVDGGTLVLFTSYSDMNAVADVLEVVCDRAERRLLVQGRDGSRTDLRNRFAKAGNGILLGTDSFWTGVDVPGKALSQVIITRLPFENPSHPIVQARCEWHSAHGHNPFIALTLPEAIIQFRQGVGRLIRTHEDKGTITLLDSRLLNKPYGRQFLAVLPHPSYTVFSKIDRNYRFRPL